jgi:beta-1,3-galactosyltransferase 1
MKAIEYENEIYQDIVQEDFIDSYKNLTYKGIMALKWISIYCSKIKYILKVDDDIVVNTFTLINHLKFLDKNNLNKHSTILCLLWQAMGVMRDRLDRYRKRKELFFFCSKSKWYLSKEDFPLDKFPPYCSGSGKIFNYN